MEKISCIICTALFIFLLAGCGRQSNIPNVTPQTPSPGVWHDYIYVNEFMGFQFELPETWFIFTREEIAHGLGISLEFLHEFEKNIFDDVTDYTLFNATLAAVDMQVKDFFSDVVMLIRLRETTRNNRSAAYEYLQSHAASLGSLASNIQMGALPRRIGDTDWYYMAYEMQEGHTQADFVSIQDGFYRTITIGVEGTFQDIDKIWKQFSEIEPRFINAEGIIPTTRGISSTVYHGWWNGNVYTNPSLDLKITIPAHYTRTSNDKLAQLLGLPASIFGEGLISNELWTQAVAVGGLIPVLHVYDNYGVGSILLSVQRKPLGIRRFPLEEYTQMFMSDDFWRAHGADIQTIPMSGMYEIAGHQWASSRTILSLGGQQIIEDVFATMVDGYVWLLQIESSGERERQEILSMFLQY